MWADAKSDFKRGYTAYEAGDYVEVVKWWRKAAEQGHAEAQNNLGWMYSLGKGVPQDDIEAEKWYSLAQE